MAFYRILCVRKLLWALILCTCLLLMVVIIRSSSEIDDRNRRLRIEKIEEFINNKDNSQHCKLPDLPVYSPEIMKFVRQEPHINCNAAGIDWVKCEGSECRIQDKAKIMYNNIKCSFTDILRQDEFHLRDGEITDTNSIYHLRKSDVVKASCRSEGSKWSSVLTGVRHDEEIWNRISWNNLPQKGFKLNVLMFGFDSISRNTFIRKLPKSYKYLIEVLHADILKGYNIIGDGTPQALIPILTGKTELELPDTRKRIPNSHFLNIYPFIWNNYKDAGYVTAFLEDIPEQGTFTYRLNGFKDPPTDHYMRPYYIAAKTEHRKWPKLCSGSVPRHKVMMNYIQSFFSVYKAKPKFLFGFQGELSHDSYNLVGVADDDLLELLQDLNNSGVLNDTMLVLMADHGHRFAEIRNTLQGKLEERMPFFAFVLPQWFQSQFREEYNNLRENSNKLTTPFDIYSTMRNVLDREYISSDKRSISLFAKIPDDRSCADAYIEPHWCACLEWHPLSLSASIVNRLGITLVSVLNNYTSTHRDLCETLKLSEVLWVLKLDPNQNLLKFNRNADIDGFVPDMSAKMKIRSDIYQIKALLVPGNSLFEASISHFHDTDEMSLKLSDVSRVNMYGKQARCIEENYPNLRKYCYCRD